MRIHKPDAVLKSGEIEWPGVILAANVNNATSTTGITFHQDMSNGLDAGYDAGAFKANSTVNIFTQLAENNGVDFGLQCLPESATHGTILPLGIETSAGGEVTFSLEKVLFSPFNKVALEDRMMGTTTVFENTSDTYTALVEKGSASYGRFFLVFGETTGTVTLNKAAINAWFSNGKIIINGELSGNAKLALYDIRGRKIRDINSQEMNGNTIQATNLVTGVYLLNIVDGGRHSSIKLPVTKGD
jgi:hypothetical protein